MEYRIKRRELMHEDREDHKYVAKVSIKNGKYRYFYSKDEYQKYIGQKKDGPKPFEKLKNVGKKIQDIGKKAVSFLDKKKDQAVDSLLKTKDQINKGAEYVAKKLEERSKSKAEEKSHKYIAKVELPNGKYRYFYDKDEYNAYLKRNEYQENEPDFMKNIPDMDPDEVYTEEEDMAEINEEYDPNDLAHSMNCMSCTTAYELRRRGYDVEAVADTDGESLENLYNWYKDPEIYSVNEGYLQSGDQLENAIKTVSPNESRGNIMVAWDGGGGHSMAYEVDSDGEVTIRCCQTNTVIDSDDLVKYVTDAYFVRTDNLELQEGVLDYVKPN